MAIQLGTTYRNAMLDQFETTVGTTMKIRIFTGSQPANCAAADSGTKLAEIAAPSDYMANASSGSKNSTGHPWSTTGLAAGTAGYFRAYDSAFATCHMQGSVGTSGTDMIIDNAVIGVGQTVNITAFNISAPGA
jgi:hypothetical protein